MKKFSVFIFLLSAGCTASKHTTVAATSPCNIPVDGKIFATAYMQRSAEYRALCFQAYNIARLRLDQVLQTTTAKPKAIVTDIDETVLDNSAYEVHQLLQGKDYEAATWNDWSNRAAADTVPGAPSFFKYAGQKGVEVFYITNREEKERAGTLKNLQHFNLPNADDAHLILRKAAASKESRRQQVTANHDIIMLLGDNLSDFSALFDRKMYDERLHNVNSVMSEFGNRFIVLPNPVYGDWEASLFQYNYSLSTAQKDSVLRTVLKGY